MVWEWGYGDAGTEATVIWKFRCAEGDYINNGGGDSLVCCLGSQYLDHPRLRGLQATCHCLQNPAQWDHSTC